MFRFFGDRSQAVPRADVLSTSSESLSFDRVFHSPTWILPDAIVGHVEHLELSNGFKVFVVPMPASSSVTLELTVGVGNRMESPTERGLAHFLEHMVFLRTQKRSELNAITREVEECGGEINAATGREITRYTVRLPATSFELGCDVLSDMTFTPAFNRADFENEKGVVLAEFRTGGSSAFRERRMANLLPEDLCTRILGTEASISQFTPDDVLSFWRRHYRPSNTTLVIAGGMPRDAEAIIVKLFGSIHSDAAPVESPASRPSAPSSQGRIVLDLWGSDRTTILFDLPMAGRTHADVAGIRLINELLAGRSFHSLLNSRLRTELGMVYDVGVFHESYQGAGYLSIETSAAPKDSFRVIEETMGILREISAHGITLEQRDSAIASCAAAFQLNLDNSRNTATHITRGLWSCPSWHTPSEILEVQRQLKVTDLRRIAREFFNPAKLKLAISGSLDASLIEPLLVNRFAL